MSKSPYLKYLIILSVTIIGLHFIFSYFDKSLTFTAPWKGEEEYEEPADVVKFVTTTVTKTMAVETVTTRVPKPTDVEIATATSATKELKKQRRANATFLVYLQDVSSDTLQRTGFTFAQLENRFNRNYQYPYVFLSDVPVPDNFKEYIGSLTKAKCEYGVIPKSQLQVPEHINKSLLKQRMKELEDSNIVLGGSLSYRISNRFLSGFFQHHELLEKYDYYWRVEDGSSFYCNLDYDPFLYLQDNNIRYGFTISLYEYRETLPTFWKSVKEFMNLYPEYISDDNWIDFLSDDDGMTYNLCHFWSNFEIVDLRLFRDESYTKFFDFLDQKGGFFYERWADAPIHSTAAALFLNKNQIHFFNDIGYKQIPFIHCPSEQELQDKCSCDPQVNFDFHSYSCTKRWLELIEKYDIKYPRKQTSI